MNLNKKIEENEKYQKIFLDLYKKIEFKKKIDEHYVGKIVVLHHDHNNYFGFNSCILTFKVGIEILFNFINNKKIDDLIKKNTLLGIVSTGRCLDQKITKIIEGITSANLNIDVVTDDYKLCRPSNDNEKYISENCKKMNLSNIKIDNPLTTNVYNFICILYNTCMKKKKYIGLTKDSFLIQILNDLVIKQCLINFIIDNAINDNIPNFQDCIDNVILYNGAPDHIYENYTKYKYKDIEFGDLLNIDNLLKSENIIKLIEICIECALGRLIDDGYSIKKIGEYDFLTAPDHNEDCVKLIDNSIKTPDVIILRMHNSQYFEDFILINEYKKLFNGYCTVIYYKNQEPKEDIKIISYDKEFIYYQYDYKYYINNGSRPNDLFYQKLPIEIIDLIIFKPDHITIILNENNIEENFNKIKNYIKIYTNYSYILLNSQHEEKIKITDCKITKDGQYAIYYSPFNVKNSIFYSPFDIQELLLTELKSLKFSN